MLNRLIPECIKHNPYDVIASARQGREAISRHIAKYQRIASSPRHHLLKNDGGSPRNDESCLMHSGITRTIAIATLVSLVLVALALVSLTPDGARAQDETSGAETQLKQISIGDADAPVRIDEYASLTCSHCASFHNSVLPELKGKYIDTGKARLVVHAYPLNKPALDASMLVQCMPDNSSYNFMSLLFENQKKWAHKDNYKQALKQNARLAGMSNDTADQCLNDTQLRKTIVSNMQQNSKKLDISSTPTFILNKGEARLVGARSSDVFADKIDSLLDEATTDQ